MGIMYGRTAIKWKEAEGDDLSSLSTDDSTAFRFTSSARGSRKYEGWTKEGMQLYNKVMEVLAGQRMREESGSTFDDKVLAKLSMKRKRSRGGEQINEAPRARNNLDRLMQKQNIVAI